jgi:flagellar motor switch protein FliM
MSEHVGVGGRTKRVVVYDFKRPDKFSKEQIRTIAIIHETFTRLLMARLMPLFGRPVSVHVAAVDQCTYEEFIRSVSTPTCLSVIGMEPLRGQALIEIDPGLAFSMLDMLFGGEAEGGLPTTEWRKARRFDFDPGSGNAGIVPREFTTAEVEVMADIFSRFMDGLRQAWSNVIDMRPRCLAIENNPLFAQIVPPNEAVILVVLSAKIGDREGVINLAIPFLTIEPIALRLTAKYWYSSVRRKNTDERPFKERINRFTGIGLDAELCADGPVLSLREIGNLRKGVLLPLARWAEGSAHVRMGGELVLRLRGRDPNGPRQARYEVEAAGEPSPEERAAAETEAAERIDAAIKTSMQEMQSTFASSLSDINQGIGDLKSRQERLEERIELGLSAPEGELPGAPPESEPFAYLGELRPETAAGVMQKEGAQLIALVASHLDAKAASSLLAALAGNVQAEVAGRIARLGSVNAAVVDIVDGVFKRIVSDLPRSALRASGGVEKIIDILNLAERSVERNVVESLEKSDPALAEEIKSLMFVFEDIVMIDAKQVGLVLARVDRDTLLKAMKAIPDEVRDFLWGCVKDGERAALKEAFEGMERVRLHDAEDAQQRIVALIREMEGNGEIVVARPGELINGGA